jgi:hypothetical protein
VGVSRNRCCRRHVRYPYGRFGRQEVEENLATPSESDLVWIKDSLARIEGRLDDEGERRDEICQKHSARLSSLERWRSTLIGAWVVVTTEATIALAILGLVASRGGN